MNLLQFLVIKKLKICLNEKRPQVTSNANQNIREAYDRWVNP